MQWPQPGTPDPCARDWPAQSSCAKLGSKHASEASHGKQAPGWQRRCLRDSPKPVLGPQTKHAPDSITNLAPQRTRITNRGQLFEGESVELECISSGSRPPAEISWRLDGSLLLDAYLFVSPDENSTTSAVSFTPRREHDGKLLTCEASNPLLENSSQFDEWRLLVYYKPEVSLRLVASCKQDAVHLSCEAKANPRVSRFTWKLNGTTVDSQRPAREGDPAKRLSQASLKTNLTGSFLCSAENSEGITNSDTLLLQHCSRALKWTFSLWPHLVFIHLMRTSV